MSTKDLLNILIIFLIFVLVGVVLYISFGPGWSGKEASQPPKKEFDFQIVLPEDSPYKLEELDLAVKTGAFGLESEDIEPILIDKGKFKFPNEFSLSEEKPSTRISVSTQQGDKNEDYPLPTILSAQIFYRPFAEENFSEELFNSLEPYLWPSQEPININVSSAAVDYMIFNYSVDYLLLWGRLSGSISDTNNPIVLRALFAGLSDCLSSPKFLELKDKIKASLFIEGQGYFFDEEVDDLGKEIIHDVRKEPELGISEIQFSIIKCGENQDCLASCLEKCVSGTKCTVFEGDIEIYFRGVEGDICVFKARYPSLGVGLYCRLPGGKQGWINQSHEILLEHCQIFSL